MSTADVTRRPAVPRRPGDATWTPVDSRGLLSSADQALVHRFAQAVTELDQFRLRLPAVLHVMRDNQAGQPKGAMVTDRDGGPVPWCWLHEQDITACDADGYQCTGEIVTGPSDTTGQAAVVADRAARHHHELTHRMESIVRVARDIMGIEAGYPTGVLEDEEVEPSPGQDLCRACWKDSRYAQHIELRADGSPYYRGLCRWCGQQRKIIGGDKLPATNHAGDPPTWMVEMHHRGQRILPHHHARAAKAVATAVSRAEAKAKGKRKRR